MCNYNIICLLIFATEFTWFSKLLNLPTNISLYFLSWKSSQIFKIILKENMKFSTQSLKFGGDI